ncbi:indole-3-glycerol phosphate synthase TrpC [Mastigocoleus testarum]|uniref:Indole-3-glycerol phosphate synthase n=1 Tax=Mastigocoleus testarum BC008 TaxID=371196 RepID=A0A0V7ZDF0_9CYAN|nr:indole-3-glycerol phosphate synthase TrpC [Mastigocoleus testarum]KST62568.1 indole-3-glycerol phosphate synthase [Mastigocoleus testarum BC008]KST62606.1 indole-3-glycerol phosphate synthase [Mastigocoleus testarum BC008]
MIANQQVPKFQHILEKIVLHKRQEVNQKKESFPLTRVKQQFASPPQNFLRALRSNQHKPAIIAEAKKASPSRGIIRADFNPAEIARAYENGGASCISVLTDEKFFQGSFNNLQIVRNSVKLPLLCKEFIVDPYQIYLARVNGADAVLLIAAILSDLQLIDFLEITYYLGMTALVEVHTLAELDRVLKLPKVQLVGINNRNLETFKVDLGTTKTLLTERRQELENLGITVVSESGLYTRDDLNFVAQAGAEAVLIGESLVKQSDIEKAVRNLLPQESKD